MHWIFKNKDQGKTAAAASLGLISLWDVEGGLPQIDKFLYSKDPYVVAGARSCAAACAAMSMSGMQDGLPQIDRGFWPWGSEALRPGGAHAGAPFHTQAQPDQRMPHILGCALWRPASSQDTSKHMRVRKERGVHRSLHAFSGAAPGCDADVPCCAGALLAVGVLNCGVQHENDPAYALLYEFVEKPDATIRIGAIMGLGMAYAGVPGSHMVSGSQASMLASQPMLKSGLRQTRPSSVVPRSQCGPGLQCTTMPACLSGNFSSSYLLHALSFFHGQARARRRLGSC